MFAVVIGRACKNVTKADALNYVLGHTCADDVSARDWQIKRAGGQWCRGETFDNFAPLGPRLVTADEIPDPNTLGAKTISNGQTLQDWNTNDMIVDVPDRALLCDFSSFLCIPSLVSLALMVVQVVFGILAGLQVKQGVTYRYPFSIKMVT